IFGVEHAARNQCPDPGGEIVGGGDDATGRRGEGMIHSRIVLRQEGASSCRSLNLRRIRRFAHQRDGGASIKVTVRGRLRHAVRGGGGEHGVLHAKRLEQPFLHSRGQRSAIHLLGDEAEQHVVGIVVLVLCTRREIGWVRECNCQ